MDNDQDHNRQWYKEAGRNKEAELSYKGEQSPQKIAMSLLGASMEESNSCHPSLPIHLCIILPFYDIHAERLASFLASFLEYKRFDA